MILPFLYLGPSAAAKDIAWLKEERITMLFAVRNTASAHARLLSGVKAAAELGIAADAVDVSGNQELIAAFPRAIKRINDHLTSFLHRQAMQDESKTENGTPSIVDGRVYGPGKVLVFCESGNERSAALVAAYLMAVYNMDFVQALQYIQSQRFCVAFDESLKSLLWAYNDILMATRDVGAAGGTFPPLLEIGAQRKRNRDAKAEDVEMENLQSSLDQERFEGRTSFVPFQDAPSWT